MSHDTGMGTTQRELGREGRHADENAALKGQTNANANAGFDASADQAVNHGATVRTEKRAKRHSSHADEKATIHADEKAGLSTGTTTETSTPQ